MNLQDFRDMHRERSKIHYFFLPQDIIIEIMNFQDFQGMYDLILILFNILYSNLLDSV